VPTIVCEGGIHLKVFFSDTMRHKAPHVHVYIGGESVAVVGLVTLKPLAGGPLPRRVRRLIEANAEALWDAWEDCNG
jgi:hypothetical protein